MEQTRLTFGHHHPFRKGKSVVCEWRTNNYKKPNMPFSTAVKFEYLHVSCLQGNQGSTNIRSGQAPVSLRLKHLGDSYSPIYDIRISRARVFSLSPPPKKKLSPVTPFSQNIEYMNVVELQTISLERVGLQVATVFRLERNSYRMVTPQLRQAVTRVFSTSPFQPPPNKPDRLLPPR